MCFDRIKFEKIFNEPITTKFDKTIINDFISEIVNGDICICQMK